MNIHENGTLCTKKALWKKKAIIHQLVEYFEGINFEFIELVIGEPNNFVFADEVHEIDQILKKKGFFGIRIKFKSNGTQIEIHSNTKGINNVKYEIYTEDNNTLTEAKKIMEEVANIIGSTSEALVKSTEFIARQRKIRNGVVIGVVLVVLYFLNVHVLLLGVASLLYSFVPFLLFYLILSRFLRR